MSCRVIEERLRGYTLVELLIVVTIIGILSAIVLVSLNTARNKGYDAAIQSDLSTVQVQAQLYSNTNGNYGPDYALPSGCPTTGSASMFSPNGPTGDPIMAAAIAHAKTSSGGATVRCWSQSSTGSYVVQASLRAGVGGKMYWCVDSSGSAQPSASALNFTGTAVCPN